MGLNLAAYISARGEGDLSASANVVDAADQFSLNLDHRFSDRAQLTGTYMYYDSDEPFAQYYGEPADVNSGVLFRRVHLLSLNQTVIPSSDRVLTFRYGYFSFDDDYSVPEFDPAELGFSERFLDQATANVFPYFFIDGYGDFGGWATDDSRHYSHSANGTASQFLGNHTLKLGGDYRRIGQDFLYGGPRAGDFGFDPGFTQGPDPLNPDGASGNALASLLLGYPSGGSVFTGARSDQFIDYYAGFVQDDWRITPNLVLNLGLRLEHESGPREKENRQTVGFDRDQPWPVQPVEGMVLRGGLMYAGVDGYPEYQGDPQALKWGPRAGFAWSFDEETVLRGGYGVFWAPYQPTFESRYGFEDVTSYLATADGGLTPAGTLSDPFPFGVTEPTGGSLGLLTQAGSSVDFPDQFRKSPYVQQYSLEIQREIPGAVVVSAGYVGSRSDRLGIGGNFAAGVNINQVDPAYQSLGSALVDPVPNPFFGNPVFGDLSQSETLPRAQLLRPYPQFGGLYALQQSAGRRRYDAAVLKLEKRFRGAFGGRVNYTWSRTEDNVIGEGNAYANRNGSALNNYDLDSEYTPSITDTPHRLNVSGFVELPFGKGKRWLDSEGVWNALLGAWSVSAAGYYQSGFPIAVSQRLNNTGLLGDVQRPNVVPGVDPGHSGATVENLNSYLDPDAWSLAPAFTFGDSPRTDTRVRTPIRHNWDFAFQKSERVGGGQITARVEIINAFDRPDFAGPVTVLGNPNFGRILGVNGFPRLFQFTVRYQW